VEQTIGFRRLFPARQTSLLREALLRLPGVEQTIGFRRLFSG